MESDIAALLYGVALHFAMSMALGILFTAILPGDFPAGTSSALGLGYGLIAAAVMTSAVLPEVNPLMRERMPDLGGAWVIAHGLFGLALGVAPPLRRWSAARPSRARSSAQIPKGETMGPVLP